MAYEYESREVRALRSIDSKTYNKDLVKNLQKLNEATDYMAQYMIVMQKGIDDANKNTVQKIQDFINDIIIIFDGGEDTGFQFGDLQYVFQALGALFGLGGLTGPANLAGAAGTFFDNFLKPLSSFRNTVNGWIHDLFEVLFGWLEGVPFIGDFIQSIGEAINSTRTTAESAVEQIEAVQGQVQTIQNLVFIRSGRPLYEGIDPTGESVFPFSDIDEAIWGNTGNTDDHTHSGGDLKARVDLRLDNVISRFGFIRHGYDGLRKQVSFVGRRQTTGSIYLDIYKFNEDYTSTLVYSSPNLDTAFSANNRWVQVDVTDFLVSLGDVYMYHLRVGSGIYFVVGVSKFVPEPSPLIPYRPLALGGRRPTNTAPGSFTQAEVDSWAHEETPFIQVGSFDENITQPRRYFDNFNATGAKFNMGNPNWMFYSFDTFGDNTAIGIGSKDGVAKLQGTGQAAAAMCMAQFVYPIITEDFIIEWDPGALDSNIDRMVSAFAHCKSNFNSRVEFNIKSDACYISNRGAKDSVQTFRASKTGMSGNALRWKGTYTSADKTYRLYRNNVLQISWADPTNLAGRTNESRYGGIAIGHYFFIGDGTVDNWDFRDASYG